MKKLLFVFLFFFWLSQTYAEEKTIEYNGDTYYITTWTWTYDQDYVELYKNDVLIEHIESGGWWSYLDLTSVLFIPNWANSWTLYSCFWVAYWWQAYIWNTTYWACSDSFEYIDGIYYFYSMYYVGSDNLLLLNLTYNPEYYTFTLLNEFISTTLKNPETLTLLPWFWIQSFLDFWDFNQLVDINLLMWQAEIFENWINFNVWSIRNAETYYPLDWLLYFEINFLWSETASWYTLTTDYFEYWFDYNQLVTFPYHTQLWDYTARWLFLFDNHEYELFSIDYNITKSESYSEPIKLPCSVFDDNCDGEVWVLNWEIFLWLGRTISKLSFWVFSYVSKVKEFIWSLQDIFTTEERTIWFFEFIPKAEASVAFNPLNNLPSPEDKNIMTDMMKFWKAFVVLIFLVLGLVVFIALNKRKNE